MDLIASGVIEIGAAQSFLTGKYSDFELKLDIFEFKVHKVIICTKSRYFEKLCSSRYLEGWQGYGNLEDSEDPAMIARMLQVIYLGEYGSAMHEAMLPAYMRHALCEEAPISLATAYIGRVSYLTHASLYAMGDAYEFPLLSAVAKSKFVAAVHDPDFSLEDLVQAIDVVYATTPDEDDGLRKHVVYQAQANMQQLKTLDSFKEVYEKWVGFSWDFGLEYGARKKVWCTNCKQDSKLPSTCNCGFNGLCGSCKACNELDWTALKCSLCKKTGPLVKDKPNDNDEVSIIRARKRRRLAATQKGPSSGNKKRESTL